MISLLGSTGSIGRSTLAVARHLRIPVAGLAAHSNIDRLEEQAAEFKPELIAVYDESKALELKRRLPSVEVVAGLEGVKAVATLSNAEVVISAMSGSVALEPTLAAIRQSKRIGLANKEILVAAGEWVMEETRKAGATLIPVDSEHSAIYQCLKNETLSEVSRLILTASGGPFRTREDFESITVDEALNHPTWSMGPKITIDSSTLMNKGLEVIEAHHLFGIDAIDVVIHPQSLIHSMVEFVDGAILAQMSKPSMQLPIQYALTYPKRVQGTLQPFDFLENRVLEFRQPDLQRFVCLSLAYQALEQGGSMPCFLNAANEVLVQRFLTREISWVDIGTKLQTLTAQHAAYPIRSLEDVSEVDKSARQLARGA